MNISDYTVLVIDDAEVNLDLVVETLGELYDVSVAMDSESAFEIIKEDPPDLILLDIMLPGMNGYEICKRLKAETATSTIPIIFLTAKATIEDEAKGLSLGAVDYITKPISPPILLARVKAQLQLKLSQEQLVQSEKLVALGQLIAGIAHEINTPLSAIKSSIETIGESLKHTLEDTPSLILKLSEEQIDLFYRLLLNQANQLSSLSLTEKRKVAKKLQVELEGRGIDIDTMETKNLVDLGFHLDVDRFISLLQVDDKTALLYGLSQFSNLNRSVSNIKIAGEKAAKIVFSLKTFSHFDPSGAKLQTNIQAGLETVLTIYHNQIKQNVELIENYHPLPEIMAFPDELGQVWTNIIHNALQAMKNQGKLILKTEQEGGWIKVSISDTGPGIPPEIQKKIFQPFFTTKPAGEGSGLGLDIVKKIIDKHNGTIELDSSTSEGTTFTVRLPIEKRAEN